MGIGYASDEAQQQLNIKMPLESAALDEDGTNKGEDPLVSSFSKMDNTFVSVAMVNGEEPTSGTATMTKRGNARQWEHYNVRELSSIRRPHRIHPFRLQTSFM